jgi:flagellar biosynthesis anti-sigma factor FlgM
MKVENTQPNRLSQTQVENANTPEKVQRAYEQESNRAGGLDSLHGRDQASLSERARLLAKARAQMAETQDVRAELVDKLRSSVEDGTYKVDIQRLVTKLVGRMGLK